MTSSSQLCGIRENTPKKVKGCAPSPRIEQLFPLRRKNWKRQEAPNSHENPIREGEGALMSPEERRKIPGTIGQTKRGVSGGFSFRW